MSCFCQILLSRTDLRKSPFDTPKHSKWFWKNLSKGNDYNMTSVCFAASMVCFGMSSWSREALTGFLGFQRGWISLGLLFTSPTGKDTTRAEGHADDSRWQGGSMKAQGGLNNALFPNGLTTNTRPGKSSLWTEAGPRLSKSGHILEINHSTEFPQFCKAESVGMEQALLSSSSMPILVPACLFSHVTMDFSLYHKHFLRPDKTVVLGGRIP